MALINNCAIDCIVRVRPLEEISGDAAFTSVCEDEIFIGIVDGASHGSKAHEIAQICREYHEGNSDLELLFLMKELHENLRGTIGGVAIIGKLHIESLQFRFVGIGNIYLRKFGNFSKRFVTQDGVIGYQIKIPREKRVQLSYGDILVLHTDGITSRFGVGDYPMILNDDAKTIASNLINKFGKKTDDTACIVIRI